MTVLGHFVGERVEFPGDKIDQFRESSIALELGAVPAILHTQDNGRDRTDVKVEGQLLVGRIGDVDGLQAQVWVRLEVLDQSSPSGAESCAMGASWTPEIEKSIDGAWLDG